MAPSPTIGWLRHNFLPSSETFIYTALRALVAAGTPVKVLAISRMCREKFPDADVTALTDAPLGWLQTGLYWTTGHAPAQARWAREVKLIHAHMGYTGVHALGAAARNGLPLVTSFYGHDVSIGGSHDRFLPGYWPYALRRRQLFRRGDRFLVLSRVMAAALAAQGCPPEKIRVVPLGIALARFAGPRPPRPADAPLRVLMVGREVEKKGFDDGLRACALVRDAGVQLRVVILGTGGSLRPSLERLAASLALPVEWPAPSSDVPQAMAAADVLLVPSRTAANGDQEGTPTVICEASAAGLPIVSTLHAGIPEQVETTDDARRTGFLVPERDHAGLARALIDLSGDADLRATLGANGRRKMQAEYSLAAHRDVLLATYRELLF